MCIRDRIRVGTYSKNARNGLMLRSIAPNAFSPKQRKKLASPNTPPKIAPAAGPKVTAPTATGTTISVISIPVSYTHLDVYKRQP